MCTYRSVVSCNVTRVSRLRAQHTQAAEQRSQAVATEKTWSTLPPNFKHSNAIIHRRCSECDTVVLTWRSGGGISSRAEYASAARNSAPLGPLAREPCAGAASSSITWPCSCLGLVGPWSERDSIGALGAGSSNATMARMKQRTIEARVTAFG